MSQQRPDAGLRLLGALLKIHFLTDNIALRELSAKHIFPIDERLQERLSVSNHERPGVPQLLGLSSRDGAEIEQIASFGAIATLPHFICDDLCLSIKVAADTLSPDVSAEAHNSSSLLSCGVTPCNPSSRVIEIVHRHLALQMSSTGKIGRGMCCHS